MGHVGDGWGSLGVYGLLLILSFGHLARVLSVEGLMDYPLPIAVERLSLLERQADGVVGDKRAIRRRLSDGDGAVSYDRFPIYHMLGSYFAYIWVGTPAQRVSVIIDTGSHFTAFPCAGCNCGKHIDPYFNPKASSTSEIMSCFAGNKCYIKQSYSEGSSWHAFKVRDRVWVGDRGVISSRQSNGATNARHFTATNDMVALSSNLSTPFIFGCQDREAGLFRTQQIDGIMGLTAEPDTLPFALERNGVTKTRTFALCFAHGKGVLSLGGVDPSLHLPPPQGIIKYARLLQTSGWYTVRLLDVLMKNPSTGEVESIGASVSKYNGGRGVIIDSGTTDTYLPADVAEKWNTLFAKFTNGIKYSTRQRELEDSDFDILPTIIYRLEGLPGSAPIEIEAPPLSYTENIELKSGRTKKAFRIYATEKEGTVLGANFMVGHNVIFDVERQRIGFASSECDYSDRSLSPTTTQGSDHQVGEKSMGNRLSGKEGTESSEGKYPYPHLEDINLYTRMRTALTSSCGESSTYLKKACSAECTEGGTDLDVAIHDGTVSHLVDGEQEWAQRACGEGSINESVRIEKCAIYCDKYSGRAVRGSSKYCKAEEWSSCSPSCEQQRYVPSVMIASEGSESEDIITIVVNFFAAFAKALIGETEEKWRSCKLKLQKRSCHVHKCPVQVGDSAVTMVVSIAHVSKSAWSRIYKEDLITATSKALLLPEGVMHGELLGNQNSTGIAVHMRMRIPEGLFSNPSKEVSKRISSIVQDEQFPDLLAQELNGNSASSGEWRWMVGSLTLSVSRVSVKHLSPAVGGSKVSVGTLSDYPPSSVSHKTRVAAVHAAQVDNYKRNSNPFSIDYSAYGSPLTWDGRTWMKVFVIAVIQGAAVAVFFVLRRIRAIHDQSVQDPPLAFDAYKGTSSNRQPQRVQRKSERTKSGGNLDRRSRGGASKST